MSSYTTAHKKYYEANKERILSLRAERERKWIETPQGKYSVQKRKAKQRKISWELSFEEWWRIWQESGYWEQRGDSVDKYCMSRRDDVGPYSIDNVYINSFSDNTKESYERNGVDKDGRFNSKAV